MKLNLAASNPRYELTFGVAGSERPSRKVEGPLGLDGKFRLREAQGSEPLLAVKGSWLTDSVFQVVSRSLLEGIATTYSVSFSDRSVDVSLEDNRGVRAQLRGEISE